MFMFTRFHAVVTSYQVFTEKGENKKTKIIITKKKKNKI